MLRRTLVALVLLALALPAAALPGRPLTPAQVRTLLGPVATQVAQAQTLRGRYVQRKRLPELPAPLLAHGDFLFVRDHGIRWRTVKPFLSELVITTGSLVQRDAGSEMRLNAADQPAIRLIGRIFIAVFSLDFATLEELFELRGEADPAGGWRIALVPKQAAGSLRSIEVGGDAQVERVILREGAGDVTEIELVDTQSSPAPPAAGDLAFFAPDR